MKTLRERFSAMLENANQQVEADVSDREKFQITCRRNFAPLWDAMKAISDEVASRDVGVVDLANPTPSSDRFEIIYNFAVKGYASVPITFRFETRAGPNRVTIVIGTSWDDERKATAYAIGEMDRAVLFVLSCGATFFKSKEA